jgi:hypothetical protein
MGRVNSQRESRPKERENGLRRGYGGQQLRAEKLFVSRYFSRGITAAETVTIIDSWRREAHSPQAFFICVNLASLRLAVGTVQDHERPRLPIHATRRASQFSACSTFSTIGRDEPQIERRR